MKYFPAFLKLDHKACLVVGGGDLALKKAEILLRSGTSLDILADIRSAHMEQALLPAVSEGRVRYLSGSFQDLDLSQYGLIVSASGSERLDVEVAEAAQSINCPVNVVDRTDLCTFIMPSIVDRGDVVIGISSSGASPVLARRLRVKIESILPSRLSELAAFARDFRSAVKTQFSFPERRLFWERFFDGNIAKNILAGQNQTARDEMVSLINHSVTDDQKAGRVSIVGTGPGDPDLLTLKALRVMQDADVVLYDKLIGPEILDYARRDAKHIYVGKSRANHHMAQDDINRLMVRLAREGKHVLRLKGGDPFIFGRGGEELAYLRSQNIEADVVPGITAAIGCAASGNIPLTHRDHSKAITFVTGHGKNGEEPDLDWAALANLGQTLAIYMGVATAPKISARLIEHGLAASTPVAVIENGTRENQKIATGVLSGLEQLLEQENIEGPSLLIIGDVVSAAKSDFADLISQEIRMSA